MTLYNPKTETLFNRDKDTFKVKIWDWRRPEFALIKEWFVTEKVDGTSVIFEYSVEETDTEQSLATRVHGRSRNTIFPDHVKNELDRLALDYRYAVDELMFDYQLDYFAIYGEAYGPKVQKGGGRYSEGVEFRAFDMLAGNLWLSPAQFAQNCDRLNLPRCPELGLYPTDYCMSIARNGFPSQFAKEKIAICEGIVMKPAVVLYNNRNQRLTAKLKYEDFARR